MRRARVLSPTALTTVCRTKLTRLVLDGNQLNSLDNVCHLTSLTSLSVSNNALVRVPITLAKLASLTSLVRAPAPRALRC